MQVFVPDDFFNAWKIGDIEKCKIIGKELLNKILKESPESLGWQCYIKGLAKKLDSLTATNYKKKTALLDEIRIVIQTYWVD